MTAAEKLRMEIAQEIPFSKDEFISKISRLIKAYGVLIAVDPIWIGFLVALAMKIFMYASQYLSINHNKKSRK